MTNHHSRVADVAGSPIKAFGDDDLSAYRHSFLNFYASQFVSFLDLNQNFSVFNAKR